LLPAAYFFASYERVLIGQGCLETPPSILPSESTIRMFALRVWIGLNLLLTVVLGRPLGEADSALRRRGIVTTNYASYQGVETYGDVTSYLGIPHAEPPLGDLRFRAPNALDVARVSKEAGGNVVNATQYPDFCIQGPLFRTCLVSPPSNPLYLLKPAQAVTGVELAARTVSRSTSTLLQRLRPAVTVSMRPPLYTQSTHTFPSLVPVLFYIHGGGYIFGNPANWPFDHWVHQSQEVVIVSIYYRLSIFGFLSHPEFAGGTIADNNIGFLDQDQALKWVKDHIYHFGDNPDKITIDGESAGGSSVMLHLVSTGEKVFKQAISQSLYRGPVPTMDQQKGLFDYFVLKAGCNTGNTTTTVACLRQASVSTLAIAQDEAMGT